MGAAIAFLAVLVAFPQVLFLSGSLAPSSYDAVVDRSALGEPVSVYPNPFGLSVTDGLGDRGASRWQFEPATKFMSRSLRAGQSPRWNPYQATGSLGPETMADLKYAPFTLLVAAFGATAASFTFVTLALFAGAIALLAHFVLVSLGARAPAAVVGAAVYGFSGFPLTNINSQIASPYFLFPALLVALAAHKRRGGSLRGLLAIAAHVAVYLTTFLPVALLVVALAHSVVFLLPTRHPRSQGLSGRLRVHALPSAVAGALVAFMAVPLASSLFWTQDVGAYGQRSLGRYSPEHILSVVSPRHFWHTYQLDSIPEGLAADGWVGFLGLVPLVLAIAGAPRRTDPHFRLYLLLALGVVLGVAHHLGVPYLHPLGSVPVTRMIRNEYWPALSSLSLALAAAIGVNHLADRGVRLKLLAGALAVISYPLLFHGYVARPDVDGRAVVSLVLLAALGLVCLVVGYASQHRRLKDATAAWLLALLAAAELLSYVNPVRPIRIDVDRGPPPVYLQTVMDGLEGQRVLNVGRTGLYPEWGAALGVPEVGTLNIAQSPHYQRFFRENIDDEFFLELGRDREATAEFNPAALDLLAVRYLLVEDRMAPFVDTLPEDYRELIHDTAAGMHVFENPTALPRAFLSGSVAELDARAGLRQEWSQDVVLTDDQEFLRAVRRLNPELLERGVEAPRGSATVVADGHIDVEVEVHAERESILVLSDSYHPHWRAEIDGREVLVGRVHGAFRGVLVPTGVSTVVFSYVSPAHRAGVAVSTVTLILLIVVLAIPRISRSGLSLWPPRSKG